MSNNQGYYGQGQQDNNPYHQAASNPWESEQGHLPPNQQQQHQYQQQPQQSQQSYQPYQPFNPPVQPQTNPWSNGSDETPNYQTPSNYQQSHQQDFTPQPPRRTGTDTIVPESERGEQREAMEQFELTRAAPESQVDRDVATLQREFPETDGALIAALYGDSKDLGATREMLRELSGTT